MEVCGLKNDTADMMVCNESPSIWRWELVGEGNEKGLTQEPRIEGVSFRRSRDKGLKNRLQPPLPIINSHIASAVSGQVTAIILSKRGPTVRFRWV